MGGTGASSRYLGRCLNIIWPAKLIVTHNTLDQMCFTDNRQTNATSLQAILMVHDIR